MSTAAYSSDTETDAVQAAAEADAADAPPHRRALVRRPAASLADGLVTHIEKADVDVELARAQWVDYVAALEAHGWRTIEVEPRDDLPDSVFVEDAVVLFGPFAVVTRPGADARKPETVGALRAVVDLGLEVAEIEAPATLDGGDVLTVGRTVYVGRGGRTNPEGVRQLRFLLEPRGYEVVSVPMTKALHLKSAVTALPDGTVIGWEPVVDDPEIFPTFWAVPEEAGAHVVVLDPHTVLMSAAAPRTAALFRDHGLDVVTVDISEFEKLEGCVTCLSVRVR